MIVTKELLSAGVLTEPYQLPRQEVDVFAMVDRAQNRLLELRRQAVKAIHVSPIWGEDYPSVKRFSLRAQYRSYPKNHSLASERVDMLEPNTGAINVPTEKLAVSQFKDFFTPLRIRQQGEFTQLRGLTYYTALDFSKNTPAKKLEVMTKDIREGLDVITSINRVNLDTTDYLGFLGILDHLKIHSLIAFHAITFPERTGMFPDGKDYLSTRQVAQGVMSALTRAYYQACLGQPFDAGFDPREIERSMGQVVDYVTNSGYSIEHFTFPEVINPLTIILGAHEAARCKPCPHTIIGIPSGGTEVAVATNLMYESLHSEEDAPDTSFVPLSFHYHAQGGLAPDQLVELLTRSSKLVGERVLIVDDNSNSGSTLQGMAEALIRVGAGQIGVHLAELDPARVMAKQYKEEGKWGVVNMDHPDLKTAMGLYCSLDKDGGDLRRKVIRRFVAKAHNQIEKRVEHKKLK